MIKLEHISKKKLKGNTILLLVDRLPGALKAGRFALKYLFDDQTRLILLQTFNVQGFGLSKMRNLSQRLWEISMHDLTVLKNKLIEEFGIPSGKIKKLVIEGHLATVVRQNFNSNDSLSFIIGADSDQLLMKDTNKQAISLIKKTNIRSLFLIDENITLIDRSKIIVVSDNPDSIAESTKEFLASISDKNSIDIEYVTGSDKNTPPIPFGTSLYYLKDLGADSQLNNFMVSMNEKMLGF